VKGKNSKISANHDNNFKVAKTLKVSLVSKNNFFNLKYLFLLNKNPNRKKLINSEGES